MLTVSSQFIHQNLGISVDSHSVCLSLMWVLHFSDKLAQSADSSRPDSDSLLLDFRSFFFFFTKLELEELFYHVISAT